MLNPILNRTITSLKESSTLAINQRALQMRRSGREIVHFGFGQSPFPVCTSIQAALKENSHQKDYLPSMGLPELREAFCDYYKKHIGYEFDPSCVLVGPGSKELLFQCIFVLEGPLLIPAPSWVSYGPQAHIRGKTVHVIPTLRENEYKLSAEDLKVACQHLLVSRQKILILNNPNNPTGTVYSHDELAALAEVCREEGVIVMSDEIYALNNFSGSPFQGFSAVYPEGTIVTSGLSKGHSAGGYRLGMLAAPSNMRQVIQALVAMVSETFSAVSSPIQYAALRAYSDLKPVLEHAAQCTRVHAVAASYLYDRFTKMGLDLPRPQGAFYLFPDFSPFSGPLRRKGLDTSPKLCQYLLDELLIATLPSSDFYCPEDWLACRVASVDYDGADVLEAASRVSGDLEHAFVEKHCPNLKTGCDRLENFISSL